ncbi:hypothetical protein I6A84_36325 [Frankia sp. CNm7]|uniref:Protein kinase domain-containing protein n=1 Tax=Frankia nepalensis TaxID=1836974 RepID=A0A937RI90_9ACTN|nr:hypothetical protein [Frankia nepalensis]MBL7494714.1 hypothetical protein [Frankia nepalensis]MBL7514135.1 hypothetical protein [Frankia nepalensis]MBL7523379.1 hypothetical protein [Frankia nepalensis]MBL7626501.1 hypothetical protein [Frankia nepalensis]
MTEIISFTRADGGQDTWEVEFEPTTQTPQFMTRWALASGGQRFVVRYAMGGEFAEHLVENAIRVGLRIWRRYGSEAAYPAELSRLVGYNVDCERPFVMVAEHGVPLAELTRPFDPDEHRAFAGGLASGLYLLAYLGVTHRMVRPDSVRWDAATRRAQITRFDYARLVGTPRLPLASTWASPEQQAGGGLTDHRDDVWSAGLAMLSRAIKGVVAGPTGQPDAVASGAPFLAPILDRLFAPVGERPDAGELLRRMGRAPGSLPALPDDEARFARASAEYDQLVQLKAGPPPRQQPPPPPPPPRESTGRFRRKGRVGPPAFAVQPGSSRGLPSWAPPSWEATR